MSRKHSHGNNRKSRFEIDTERRRKEMLGHISGRTFKVTHKWLRMFSRSTRKLLLAEGSMGGARCTL